MVTTNKWDKRFMEMAKMVATWSKDRSTGVGAVIVDDEKKIISAGFNGFPRGVDDNVECRHKSPEKHHWTIHAERNAILEADVPLKGMTLYCTFFTCSICAQEITQKGLKRVVAPEPDWDDSRYGEGQKIAMEMYKERGIEVSFYKDTEGASLYVFYSISCGGGEIHATVSSDKFMQYIQYYIDKYNDRIDSEDKFELNEIDLKLGIVKFSSLEKNHYLSFKNVEVDDFIHKRE